MSQKWKGFENTVAKALGAWLFRDEKALRRTPCSGGWKGRGTGVDVTIPDDRPELRVYDMFAYEMKCRKSSNRGSDGWHFEQLLTSPKHEILGWWYDLTNSKPVVEDKKLRMLVFSKTSGIAKAFIAFGQREFDFLIRAGVSVHALPKMFFDVGRCEDPNIITEKIYFFRFREFLDNVDAELLKKCWREDNGTS